MTFQLARRSPAVTVSPLYEGYDRAVELTSAHFDWGQAAVRCMHTAEMLIFDDLHWRPPVRTGFHVDRPRCAARLRRRHAVRLMLKKVARRNYLTGAFRHVATPNLPDNAQLQMYVKALHRPLAVISSIRAVLDINHAR